MQSKLLQPAIPTVFGDQEKVLEDTATVELIKDLTVAVSDCLTRAKNRGHLPSTLSVEMLIKDKTIGDYIFNYQHRSATVEKEGE